MAYDAGLAARYRGEGLWRDELLTDWLDRTVAETPDATAIVMADGSMTFAELGALSDRLAAGFRRLGIGMGDVVGVQLRNGPYWVAIHIALCRIGAVMTGIHLTFRESECERALAFGDAVAIVCEEAMGDFAIAETMLRLKARLPSLEHVIVAGGGAGGNRRARIAGGRVAARRGAGGCVRSVHHALHLGAPPAGPRRCRSATTTCSPTRGAARAFSGSPPRTGSWRPGLSRISIRCTALIFRC